MSFITPSTFGAAKVRETSTDIVGTTMELNRDVYEGRLEKGTQVYVEMNYTELGCDDHYNYLRYNVFGDLDPMSGKRYYCKVAYDSGVEIGFEMHESWLSPIQAVIC